MPLGDICSGISFRYDDSIFVALAEPWVARSNYPSVHPHYLGRSGCDRAGVLTAATATATIGHNSGGRCIKHPALPTLLSPTL